MEAPWYDRVGWLLGRASLSKASAYAHSAVEGQRMRLYNVGFDPRGKEALDPADIAETLRRRAKGKGNARFNRSVAAAIAECEAEQARRDTSELDLRHVMLDQMEDDLRRLYGFPPRQR